MRKGDFNMEDWKGLLRQDHADLMRTHMIMAPVWDVIMDILAINMTSASPFRVKLDCGFFQMLG